MTTFEQFKAMQHPNLQVLAQEIFDGLKEEDVKHPFSVIHYRQLRDRMIRLGIMELTSDEKDAMRAAKLTSPGPSCCSSGVCNTISEIAQESEALDEKVSEVKEEKPKKKKAKKKK